MSEFPHIEYLMSYKLLEDKNWNYNHVASDLRFELENANKKEADEENKIMTVMS